MLHVASLEWQQTAVKNHRVYAAFRCLNLAGANLLFWSQCGLLYSTHTSWEGVLIGSMKRQCISHRVYRDSGLRHAAPQTALFKATKLWAAQNNEFICPRLQIQSFSKASKTNPLEEGMWQDLGRRQMMLSLSSFAVGVFNLAYKWALSKLKAEFIAFAVNDD